MLSGDLLQEVVEPHPTVSTVGVIGRFRRLCELHRCPENTIIPPEGDSRVVLAGPGFSSAKQNRTARQHHDKCRHSFGQHLPRHGGHRFGRSEILGGHEELVASQGCANSKACPDRRCRGERKIACRSPRNRDKSSRPAQSEAEGNRSGSTCDHFMPTVRTQSILAIPDL